MALGDEMARSGGGRTAARRTTARSRRRRRVKRGVVIGLSVVLLLVVGSGAGYIYYLTHGLNRVEVRGLHGSLRRGRGGHRRTS